MQPHSFPSVSVHIHESMAHFFAERTFSQCVVLVDDQTLQHCYPKIAAALPAHRVVEVPQGEVYKTLDTCQQIWQALTEAECDRSSLLINLGGGVIGDMGGFCAATFKRGIPFVQIPTTLLAQVDASIGGKTGVDFAGLKNHIGAFAMPEAVWIGTDFLETLPQRIFKSGFAEVLKHCLIADAPQWHQLQQTPWQAIQWPEVISQSVQIKSSIVNQDFRESGLRKVLNFGHTLGHALESCYLATSAPMFHGEAVAMGMLGEAYISCRQGLLGADDLANIVSLVLKHFSLPDFSLLDMPKFWTFLEQDKKNQAGHVRGVALVGIGSAVFDQVWPPEVILQALDYLRSLHQPAQSAEHKRTSL